MSWKENWKKNCAGKKYEYEFKEENFNKNKNSEKRIQKEPVLKYHVENSLSIINITINYRFQLMFNRLANLSEKSNIN